MCLLSGSDFKILVQQLVKQYKDANINIVPKICSLSESMWGHNCWTNLPSFFSGCSETFINIFFEKEKLFVTRQNFLSKGASFIKW